MLSRPPEIPTPADGPTPEIGTPSRARYSTRRTAASPGPIPASAGRHRRAGAPSAEKFLVEIPTPRRPSSLADSSPPYDRDDPYQDDSDIPLYDQDDSGPYRAAFLTDDLPFSRPAPIDPTPRYRSDADDVPGDGRRLSQGRLPSGSPGRLPSGSPGRLPSGSSSRLPSGSSSRLPSGRRRARQPSAWDKASDAASSSMAIVVRSLPTPRNGAPLPAARRLAGTVRDWALASPDGPPVTGSHRAPGTMPLESWLLIGRHRQQALLGALVAIGIMLVMIPGQRQANDVTATNAADRSVATVGANGRATGTKPKGQAEQGSSRPSPRDDPRQDAPAQEQTDKPRPSPSKSLPADAPSESDDSETAGTPDPDATASGVSPDARGPARSLRSTGTDAVALTFDDGPDPTTTPQLLKLLADHEVKATFCLVGERAQAHPELVQQIVAAGHTLCNHSWDHSFKLGVAKIEDIRKDLDDTDKAIHAAVPDVAIPYFRAPGGIFTNRLVAVANETEKKSLYWGVDPRDWDHSDDKDDATHIDRVVAAVKKNVKPGSIVLSHDFNQPDTIKAYETLLPYLTEKYELGLP